MKKYLLSIAVLLMAAITFTACSDDNDDPSGDGLAKTTFTANVVDDGDQMEVVVSFVDGSKGVQYVKTTMEDEDTGMKIPMEAWVNFEYKMDGTKVTLNSKKSTVKVMGMIEVEDFTDYDPAYLTYDKANKTLTEIVEKGETPMVLKQTKYKEIVVPTK